MTQPKSRSSLFTLREEKKHSVRYDALSDSDTDDVATSIYVSKSVLSRPYPKRIRLTVEEVQ